MAEALMSSSSPRRISEMQPKPRPGDRCVLVIFGAAGSHQAPTRPRPSQSPTRGAVAKRVRRDRCVQTRHG
jgi:hypothetical protein